PMSLLAYEDVRDWSDTIAEVVEKGRMPPWFADPRYGDFLNARGLSTDERETLLKWIADQCPRGPAVAPPTLPPLPRSGWRIGTPDVTFTVAEEFEIPAHAPPLGIPYQFYVVDTHFTEDKWIVAGEIRTGSPKSVHHIRIGFLRADELYRAGQFP